MPTTLESALEIMRGNNDQPRPDHSMDERESLLDRRALLRAQIAETSQMIEIKENAARELALDIDGDKMERASLAAALLSITEAIHQIERSWIMRGFSFD